MKKLTVMIILVLAMVIASPGFAQGPGLKEFMKKVQEQAKVSGGRAEVIVESGTILIFMFALKDTMVKMKYDKQTDTYTINPRIKKLDGAPSKWDQEPIERIREAIAVYGYGPKTE